jgi:hypothetical protein
MKKNISVVLLVLVVVFMLAISQVFAAPAIGAKPSKTPGNNGNSAEHGKGFLNGLGAAEKGPKQINLKGTVAAVDAAGFTLALRDGSLVTVSFGPESTIKIPKLNPHKKVKDTTLPPVVLTLQPGQNVMAKVSVMPDGSYVAVKVNVIPGKPIKPLHVGIVTAYTPGLSITIAGKDGTIATYALTLTTKYLPVERLPELAVGSLVTIIAPRDVTGGILTAKGVIIHPAGEVLVDPTETPEPTEIPPL